MRTAAYRQCVQNNVISRDSDTRLIGEFSVLNDIVNKHIWKI